jgi:hypothetical protein
MSVHKLAADIGIWNFFIIGFDIIVLFLPY